MFPSISLVEDQIALKIIQKDIIHLKSQVNNQQSVVRKVLCPTKPGNLIIVIHGFSHSF